MTKELDVSIILVNYKTSNLTADIVKSISEHTESVSYEIIIVDNSESSNELKRLNELCPQCTIIQAEKNLGFGKANNLGFNSSVGRNVLFLNTDTILMNDAISIMSKFLDEHFDVAVVGPNLYKKDLAPNNSYELEEKNLKTDGRGYLANVFHRLFGNKNGYFNRGSEPLQIFGYICGAALMIKRDAFEELNGFSEKIFMYAEDSLICYQTIHQLNKKIYNLPEAKIIHFEGGSFNNLSLTKAGYIAEGNFIYYETCFGRETAIKYLKKSIKRFKQKTFLCTLLLRKNAKEEASTMRLSYMEELKKRLN